MNPLAWLVSLAMPACGFPGAEGLPAPVLVEPSAIVRPSSPNSTFAAPAGFKPAPDIVTGPYHIPPDALFATVQAVASRQPRTYPSATFPDRRQAHYVARSAVFNFPDLIMVQVIPGVIPAGPAPDGSNSELILYSRSVYGHSDLGVNRKRAETWLAALQADLPSSKEK